MNIYRVIDEITENGDRYLLVRSDAGKVVAYLFTGEGYAADYDATDSSDPGRATVWFDATDENYQARHQGKQVTNAHGEPVTIVSASDYGMPDNIETVAVLTGCEDEDGEPEAAEMAIAHDDWEGLA